MKNEAPIEPEVSCLQKPKRTRFIGISYRQRTHGQSSLTSGTSIPLHRSLVPNWNWCVVMLVDKGTELKCREELLAAISDERFPCVGAKSAMARGALRTMICQSLESASDDVRMHRELLEWAKIHREESTGLRSLAFVFAGPQDLDEERFEAAMWQRLQSLAHLDQLRGQPYDCSVSSDPDDPNFALSFGGAAFFVVGLHPNASRPARRMPRPTLVFNLHAQYELLRKQGRYERMRERIISRDLALTGSVNPMLARFGEASEARQYSGRMVGSDWRCPFHDPRAL